MRLLLFCNKYILTKMCVCMCVCVIADDLSNLELCKKNKDGIKL